MPSMPGEVHGGKLQINQEGNSTLNDWNSHPFALQGTDQTLFAGVDSLRDNAYFQSAGVNTGNPNRVVSGIALNPQGGNVRIGSLDANQGGWPISGLFGDIFRFGVDGSSIFRGNTFYAGSKNTVIADVIPFPQNIDLGFKLNVDGGTTTPLNGIVSNNHGGPGSYGVLSKVSDDYAKGLAVINTTTGIENFRVSGNGETYAGGKLTVDTGTNTGDLAEFRGDGNVIIKPGEDTGEVTIGTGTQLGVDLKTNGNVYAIGLPQNQTSLSGHMYYDGQQVACSDQLMTNIPFTNTGNGVTFNPTVGQQNTYFDMPAFQQACQSQIAQYPDLAMMGNQTVIGPSNSSCSATPTFFYSDCPSGPYANLDPNGLPPVTFELSASYNINTFSDNGNGTANVNVSYYVKMYNDGQTQITGDKGNFIGYGANLSSLGNGVDEQLTCSDANGWLVPCSGAGIPDGTMNGQTLRWDFGNQEWRFIDNNLLNDGMTVSAKRQGSNAIIIGQPNPDIFIAHATNITPFGGGTAEDLGIRVAQNGTTRVDGKLTVFGNSDLIGYTRVGVTSNPKNLTVTGNITNTPLAHIGTDLPVCATSIGRLVLCPAHPIDPPPPPPPGTYPNYQIIDSSTTWTPPPGINFIRVELWGAGKGGTGGTSSASTLTGSANSEQGAGGRSGGYIRVVDLPVQQGVNYDLVIGASGSGGEGGHPEGVNDDENVGLPGGDGGDTKFVRQGIDLLIAKGGGVWTSSSTAGVSHPLNIGATVEAVSGLSTSTNEYTGDNCPNGIYMSCGIGGEPGYSGSQMGDNGENGGHPAAGGGGGGGGEGDSWWEEWSGGWGGNGGGGRIIIWY
jgi:hypothetical protein